jgi:pyruvate dehydrogenase E2 component (dihydrolipoamide acetyltransferase)
MAVEIYVNKMSEHMETAEIIQWLAGEGDVVAEHQPILEVMTDKFTVELESPAAGVLAGIRPGCVAGATVPVGEAIAFIVKPGENAPRLSPFAGAQPTLEVQASPHVAAPPAGAANGEGAGRVKSTPVARKMARDAGIDIESLVGSGPGGRVMEADIAAAIAARTQPPAQPAPMLTPPRATTEPVAATVVQPSPSPLATPSSAPVGASDSWVALTPFQRITGERMRESVLNAPQFALEVRADATNLLWLREALDGRITLEARARLTLTGLLVKVVAAALERHPRVKAQFVDGKLLQRGDCNVGVAVGTDQGLVVPVVRQANLKTLAHVTAELAGFQEKARTMHFAAEDLAGGTITLSNLGMYGIERFAAIVNPPQAAILAAGAVVRTPVAMADDTVAVKPLMALTLTVDHRVLDGVQAARFLADLKERVEKPYFLI